MSHCVAMYKIKASYGSVAKRLASLCFYLRTVPHTQIHTYTRTQAASPIQDAHGRQFIQFSCLSRPARHHPDPRKISLDVALMPSDTVGTGLLFMGSVNLEPNPPSLELKALLTSEMILTFKTYVFSIF